MALVNTCGAPRPKSPLSARVSIAMLIVMLPTLSAVLYAQGGSAVPQVSANSAVILGADLETSEVHLLVGRSTVLNVPSPITRVSLTSPEVADALVTTSQQVLVHGKTAGTISMFVWDRAGGIRRYEVIVRRDLSELTTQVRQLFPGEPITVAGNGKDVVLSGTVSSKYVMEKAADVAAGYVEKKENVVNLLQQIQGVASNQVLLRVRFAEVSRSALQELGTSFFTGPTGYKDFIGRVTTEQFSAPGFADLQRTEVNGKVTAVDGKFTFSDFLNLFLFNTKYNVGTVIRALQQKGMFQSLAEPNLIAQNGTESSFLAGGEYPYPVVQGAGSASSVTIQFKEFGIKLNFTPTILGGDLIHLKVRPEVSALDFTNAISIQGFRVPSLSTRRTETELELRDGQTFAIAGLLNNTTTQSLQRVPGIGDIPILGLLFRSKALQQNQTELVVMITPQIIRPGSPGAAPDLPQLLEPYMAPPAKTVPPPLPFGTPGPRGSVAPATDDNARANTPAQPAAKPAVSAPSASAPSPAVKIAPAAPVASAPVPPKLGKQEQQAAELARKEEATRLAAEARAQAIAARGAAAQAKIEANRAAAQREIEAKETAKAKEQERAMAAVKAKQSAEAAQKAEIERKEREEVERKRGKALAEAEARLKAAQAAYQEQMKRSSSSQNQ